MRFNVPLLILLLLVGGCRKPDGKVLGKPPTGKGYSVIAVKAGDTPHTNHVTMTIMAGAVDIRALEE